MYELREWIRTHPVKAVVFFALSVACGLIIAGVDVAFGAALLCICIGAWMVVFMLDGTRFLSLLTAASLLFAQTARAQQFQPAAPLVIGGIVIIVAAGLGFVGCRAANRCKKIGANRDRQLTNESPFRVAGEAGEYGAAFFWSEPGYCAAERLLPVAPTLFVLDITVESVSNATVTCTASTGENFVQSWESFEEELAGHGLAVATGLNSGSYERNRHPVTFEQVPITFDWHTRTATVGAGGVLVSVERSADLRTWEPLLSLNVEAGGLPLRIEDASATQQFYRVKLSTP